MVSLDIPIILPSDDVLVLDEFFGKGKQQGEVELPEDAAAGSLPKSCHIRVDHSTNPIWLPQSLSRPSIQRGSVGSTSSDGLWRERVPPSASGDWKR